MTLHNGPRSGDIVRSSVESDMDAFDHLPPMVREALRHAEFKVSAEAARDVLNLSGNEGVVVFMIRKTCEANIARR